jgi:hypothetical protein
LRSVLERHGLEVTDVAAQGGPILLVAHYLINGLAQAISILGRRLGPLGALIDNPLVRNVIALPQEAIRSRVSFRPTSLSRAASLGYMAVGQKPA